MSTANLERVRKVKTRHQRLYTRVVTVREELQRFLEDDDDMMKMCLTRKKELERMVSSGHGGPATHIGTFPYVGIFRNFHLISVPRVHGASCFLSPRVPTYV